MCFFCTGHKRGVSDSKNWHAIALQRRVPNGNNNNKDSLAAEQMTTDMETLLLRLQQVVDSMSSTLKANGGTSSVAHTHTLQRHTEILHDYNQEFRKTRGSIKSMREHAELMAGARIDTAKARSLGASSAASDTLYAERASIASATNGADSAINSGLSLKEDLERQRAMFASMVERMETMSEGLPAVNRLIGQIRRKKKRDVLIISAVVATLLFITFSWKVVR